MVLSIERFVGKAAVVTGAGSGIGQAIAEKLVEAGLLVLGFDVRPQGLEETSKKTAGKKGKFHPFVGDISKEEDVISAFKSATDNYGPVHVLVNAAGVMFFQDTLMDGDVAKWKKVFDINVIGLSLATREAIRGMRAKGIDGHIVHINSAAGHQVSRALSAYPASKFAVTALTETLRQELNQSGSKIKITSVSPGGTRTNIATNNDMVITEEMMKSMAVNAQPTLQPGDLAEGVLYVLSTPPHVQVHELTIKPVGEILF